MTLSYRTSSIFTLLVFAGCSGGGSAPSGAGPAPIASPSAPAPSPSASALTTASIISTDLLNNNVVGKPIHVATPYYLLDGSKSGGFNASAQLALSGSAPPTVTWALQNNQNGSALSYIGTSPNQGVFISASAPGLSTLVGTAGGSATASASTPIISYSGFDLGCSGGNPSNAPSGISLEKTGAVVQTDPMNSDLYLSGPTCNGPFNGPGATPGKFPSYGVLVAPYGATILPISSPMTPDFPSIGVSLATAKSSTTIALKDIEMIQGSSGPGNAYLLVKTKNGETAKLVFIGISFTDVIAAGAFELSVSGTFPY